MSDQPSRGIPSEEPVSRDADIEIALTVIAKARYRIGTTTDGLERDFERVFEYLHGDINGPTHLRESMTFSRNQITPLVQVRRTALKLFESYCDGLADDQLREDLTFAEYLGLER